MLIGVGVSCRFSYSIVSYFCSRLLVIMWFLYGGVYFGLGALFYCGTPWSIHIIILNWNPAMHLSSRERVGYYSWQTVLYRYNLRKKTYMYETVFRAQGEH